MVVDSIWFPAYDLRGESCRAQDPLEDLVRSAGAALIGRNRNWIRWTHIKVRLAIARCRTA